MNHRTQKTHCESMEKFSLGDFYQIGIVVKNIQNTVEKYWKVFGIGPWTMHTYRPPKLSETVVRGKPEPYTMKIALATNGSTMIELIEPLQANSIYKEFLHERGGGIHHLASHVADAEKAKAYFEKNGIGALQSGSYRDGDFFVRFVYIDTVKIVGHIVEFVEVHGKRASPPDGTFP